jgi:hypothetical protein
MHYVSLTQHSVEKFRKDFIREHSKFIHSSYLLEEDLDKTVELHGKKYRIAGLWDTIGYKKIILLAGEKGYAYTDSQEVANALGFTKFRNFVTGKEITYDLSVIYRYNQMMNTRFVETAEAMEKEVDLDEDVNETEKTTSQEDDGLPTHERDNEYVSEEDDEETPEEVDPLVRVLRGSEEDSGWVDEDDN